MATGSVGTSPDTNLHDLAPAQPADGTKRIGLGKKIIRGATISLFTRICGVALMFTAQALLARSMSQTEYGYFIYAISLIPVLAFFGKIGFEATPLRYLYEYEDKPELRNGFILTSLRVVAIASAIVSIMLTLAGYILMDFLPKTVQHTLLYSSWIIFFFSLTYVAQGFLNAVKMIFFSQFFAQILLPLVLLVVVFATGMKMNAVGGYIAYGGAMAVGAVWAWMLIFRRVFRAQPAYETDTRNWVLVSMPLFVSLLVTALLPRLGNIVVGFFESAENVAAFSVVSRIAVLFTFISTALAAIADPTISEYFQKGDTRKIQRLTRFVFLANIAIGLCGFLFTLAVGEYVLLAFGENYVACKGALLIFILGQSFNILNGPSTSLFTVTGNQGVFMKIMLSSCLSLFIFLAIGLKFGGLMGAAIATSLNMLFTSIVVVVIFRKRTGIQIV